MPGYIDIPTTTATTVNRGTAFIATAQGAVTTPIPSPSTTVTNSVATTVTGVSNGISTGIATVNGLPGSINKAGSAALGAITGAATSYLANAIKSISGTFAGGKTDLATGISGALSNIFKDTNVKTAASVPTLISDPVSTNLLGKSSAANPTSTTFKVDSLQSGSQAVSAQGTSTTGSGAALMKGVTPSTLLNRFNIDSVTNLVSTITNSFSSTKINGLFANLGNGTSGGLTGLTGQTVGGTQLGKIVGGLTTIGVAGPLGVPVKLPAASSTTANVAGITTLTQGITGSNSLFGSTGLPLSTANDLTAFVSRSDSLGKASGLSTSELSDFFVSDPTHSLVTDTGTPVDTQGSGVDSTLANALLTVIKAAGCAATSTSYNSASQLSSLFNLGLSLSAKNGMMGELNSLLGCSQATTTLGQHSLVNAFMGSANSQIIPANAILGSIASPSSLNTPYVAKTILTNPNLSANNVSLVNGMFTTIGTTTSDAMSVPGYTDALYPVHDALTLSLAQPSFVNAIYGDSSITDCFGGSEMGIQPDGSFNFI